MTYSVKEIFYTLQGEGMQSGRPAVFCRFSGCNLWNGKEDDRALAICSFCDTDFVGTEGQKGGKFESAEQLAQTLWSCWPSRTSAAFFSLTPMVVLTGGEPGLQVDQALIDALHEIGFFIAIESNGSVILPQGIDWVCISPKSIDTWKQRYGNELKLIYPQATLQPQHIASLELQFDYYYLQALDDPHQAQHIQATIAYCQKHPHWRLSLQTHKILGIP